MYLSEIKFNPQNMHAFFRLKRRNSEEMRKYKNGPPLSFVCSV